MIYINTILCLSSMTDIHAVEKGRKASRKKLEVPLHKVYNIADCKYHFHFKIEVKYEKTGFR